MNFIRRFINGEYTLSEMFWVFGVLIFLLFNAGAYYLLANYTGRTPALTEVMLMSSDAENIQTYKMSEMLYFIVWSVGTINSTRNTYDSASWIVRVVRIIACIIAVIVFVTTAMHVINAASEIESLSVFIFLLAIGFFIETESRLFRFILWLGMTVCVVRVMAFLTTFLK